MSSQFANNGSEGNASGAMLPVDDRLIVVSESEGFVQESVEVSEAAPASRTLVTSDDDATMRLSYLTRADTDSSDEKFLVKGEIHIPTCNDRACYPPDGYQTVYQDAFVAGLRVSVTSSS